MSVIFKDDQGQYKVPFMSDLCGGGVNLLTGTYEFLNWNTNQFERSSNYSKETNGFLIKTSVIAHLWGDNAAQACLSYNQPLHLSKGTYTVSFVARDNGPTSDIPSFELSLFSSYTNTHGGLAHGSTATALSSIWTNYHITFALPEDVDLTQLSLCHYDTNARIPGGSLFLANLKLEKGPVATPWSPNPLDILNDIEALKNKVGGVTRHLYARLISALATSTEMEVA